MLKITFYLIFSLFILLSCSSSSGMLVDQYKIDDYIRTHPNLSSIDRECLQNKNFKLGMTKKTAELLLGQPEKKEIVKTGLGVMVKYHYNLKEVGFLIFDDKGKLTGVE